MGDADNALPPSKKRAAGRELSRDTPLDDEEDTSEPEAGTFKKASDEVMATRRIVKVRRQPSNSAPSTNPFSGIRLISPPESSAKPAEATPIAQSTSENTAADDTKCTADVIKDSEKAKDGDVEQLESKVDELGNKSAEIKDAAKENVADGESTAEKSMGEESEVDKHQTKDHDKNGDEDRKDAEDKETPGEADKEQTNTNVNEDTKDAEDKEIAGEVEKEQTNKSDNEDKKDAEDKETAGEVEKEQDRDGNDAVNDDQKENTSEGSSLKSFQQLSSSQNAFTGLAGTGFSASSFSFGSLSNEGSALGSGSGSIFGMKNDKPFGLGLSNNGSSVFGATGASATAKGEGSGFTTMQEVVVETGEENEKVVFNADSVLFEFVEGSWKERGKGELKVNVSTGGNEKARLLMRTKGNYRLILNARLYPDIKLTNMEKKGVTFACINSANEGKDGLSTFALKFKDGSIVEEFKAAVMAHKGDKATVLKTPENSPKASDA
ncbi:nuclear pore complex protein NUP50A [Neltuma alba]|uniref:nuclear pore complex protein NUP50A-like n=1 Tax=Neltuma alba TaxID=207710 RepID=UPI0010A40BA5|nr:nuclear pore complex protein NUP50A-like [Prosopis alba]XP_028807551.1 nuclear pore complex protein NUP50A-like [Prosopis alba]